MPEPLLRDNPDKIIEAFDLFDKKHPKNLKNFRFRVSAYGILWQKKKILVQRHPDLKTFGLPGGGVEIDESIPQALSREFKEETGLKVKPGKLINILEDFFTWEDQDTHTVLIFYEVKKVGGKLLPKGNQDDTGEVKFLSLDSLNKKTTQRVFWPAIRKLKN